MERPAWLLIPQVRGRQATRHVLNTISKRSDWSLLQSRSGISSISIHSFIHSWIYIAPLRENYSEVLPTPAWSKRTVFKWLQIVSESVEGRRHSARGRPFHTIRPNKQQAWLCSVWALSITMQKWSKQHSTFKHANEPSAYHQLNLIKS